MQSTASQIIAAATMQALLQELVAEFSGELAESPEGSNLIYRVRETLAFADKANEGGAA